MAPKAKEHAAARPSKVDRTWHLATDPFEIGVTELEYALMRTFEAFGRWQAECLASVADVQATGPENWLQPAENRISWWLRSSSSRSTPPAQSGSPSARYETLSAFVGSSARGATVC